MRTIGLAVTIALGCALSSAAQTKLEPASVNVRYSEQISNGPAGSCGCFAMEGAAADVSWRLLELGPEKKNVLGGIADVSVEHTGSIDGAHYGLTLTTLAFGPRLAVPAPHHAHAFAQTLLGFTHGSNSQFPQHNSLVSSANSFAVDLGAGLEHSLTSRFDLRLLQIEYLRTGLPNNTSNWQNSLRIGAGVTVKLR